MKTINDSTRFVFHENVFVLNMLCVAFESQWIIIIWCAHKTSDICILLDPIHTHTHSHTPSGCDEYVQFIHSTTHSHTWTTIIFSVPRTHITSQRNVDLVHKSKIHRNRSFASLSRTKWHQFNENRERNAYIGVIRTKHIYSNRTELLFFTNEDETITSLRPQHPKHTKNVTIVWVWCVSRVLVRVSVWEPIDKFWQIGRHWRIEIWREGAGSGDGWENWNVDRFKIEYIRDQQSTWNCTHSSAAVRCCAACVIKNCYSVDEFPFRSPTLSPSITQTKEILSQWEFGRARETTQSCSEWKFKSQ